MFFCIWSTYETLHKATKSRRQSNRCMRQQSNQYVKVNVMHPATFFHYMTFIGKTSFALNCKAVKLSQFLSVWADSRELCICTNYPSHSHILWDQKQLQTKPQWTILIISIPERVVTLEQDVVVRALLRPERRQKHTCAEGLTACWLLLGEKAPPPLHLLPFSSLCFGEFSLCLVIWWCLPEVKCVCLSFCLREFWGGSSRTCPGNDSESPGQFGRVCLPKEAQVVFIMVCLCMHDIYYWL